MSAIGRTATPLVMAADASVQVLVIPANEGLEIAQQTLEAVG